jgi:hypothetical protein
MKNETLQQLLGTFVQTIGRPVIEKIENETGQPIAATVLAIDGGRVLATAAIPEGELHGTRATGEVRLTFRERANSITFEGQAILHGVAEGTGYSGFLLYGKFTVADDQVSAKLNGRTITYNEWEWQPTFRCATDEVSK